MCDANRLKDYRLNQQIQRLSEAERREILEKSPLITGAFQGEGFHVFLKNEPDFEKGYITSLGEITGDLAEDWIIKKYLDSQELKVMGMFGTKKIVCPKNEWTTIISSYFAQMPVSWRIKFASEKGEAIDGIYSEKRFLWVFPQPPTEGKLAAEMVFDRYWINTFYSIKIRPTVDLIAEID